MRIKIVGKNIEITDGMRNYIETKLAKAETFLKDDTPVNVIIRTVKEDQIIEVTIHDKKIIRVEERDENLYTAIDEVENKLIRVLRKRKEKTIDAHRKNQTYENRKEEKNAEDETSEIVRIKEMKLETLTPEEAINELEALDHDFYLYFNEKTLAPEIVYRRRSGKYGLLKVV